jgi:hypothetical protein
MHSSEATCAFNATHTGIITAKGGCFPSNYGIGSCLPWDNNLLPECKSQVYNGIAGEKPDYCDKPWCYIDVANCDRPHHAGQIVLNQSYSFETCGYKDTFALNTEFAKRLTGKTLRVTCPGDFLWTLWTEPNGDRGGMYPSLIARLFREHGVDWQLQPLSNASKAASPSSSYTACIHDIAIGETDICVGETWSTDYRISLMEEDGSYTTTITQDDFYLVASKMAKKDTLWDEVASFFSIAQAEVWAATIMIVLYTSLAMYSIEGDPAEEYRKELRFFTGAPKKEGSTKKCSTRCQSCPCWRFNGFGFIPRDFPTPCTLVSAGWWEDRR